MFTVEIDDLENVSGEIPVALALVLASPVVRAVAAEMAFAAIGAAVAGASEALT